MKFKWICSSLDAHIPFNRRKKQVFKSFVFRVKNKSSELMEATLCFAFFNQ